MAITLRSLDPSPADTEEMTLRKILQRLNGTVQPNDSSYTTLQKILTQLNASVGGLAITFGAAAPTAGTWTRGAVCFNSAAAVGQPIGWQCVASGTPGTWGTMPNLS